MADKGNYAEGPAGKNGGSQPGDATSLPTKHYPSSGDMAKQGGKGGTLEGPCTDKKY